MNWTALALAVLVSFASGFAWFSPKGFYPAWVRAIGANPQPGGNMGLVFGLTFAGIVVQNLAVGWVVGLRQAAAADFGVLDGAVTGLLLGLGLAAATSLSHRLFAGHGLRAWVLEVGNDVLNLTLAGAIFALLG